jgi:hypothetical protein
MARLTRGSRKEPGHPSRRAVLAAAVAAVAAAAPPVARAAPPVAKAAEPAFLLHRGWILRADDLERLGLAGGAGK